MNRRLLYTGLLMVFPVGAFGGLATAYALAAFEALEQAQASEPSALRRATARSDAQPKPATPAPRLGDSALAPAGQGEWIYPGVVIAEPANGAVEIVFEDGDHGNVPVSSLRPIPPAGISVEASVYRDGRWSEPETCSPWRGSASYPDVTLALMRFSPDDAPAGPLTRLELDTWFRYQGKEDSYPATIVSELSTHFAVVYADGDHELAKHDAQTSPPPIGAILEVRTPSGEQWERGTLQSIEGRALEVDLAGQLQWVPPARVRWPDATGGAR